MGAPPNPGQFHPQAVMRRVLLPSLASARALARALAPTWENPVARSLLALLLFVASLSALALTTYSDQYVNGGVSWDRPAQPIAYTDVNPVAVNTFLEKEVDPDKVTRSLDMIRDGGFHWIRQGFSWNDLEISGKGNYTDARNPEHVVNAWDKYDRIVDEANKRGVEIIARLDSPPVWARFPGDDVELFRKGPPAHNEDYGDFVQAVATRYKGKIHYYQIWNEPNLWGEWGGHAVSPEEYTALLKVAYERVKAVDPNAVVITAALAPTAGTAAYTLQAENDVLFLEGMYRAGAAPYFDILSTMLYGLGQPPTERRTDLKRLNFSRPILLREVMERNGDARKPIWISEYAWISLPPGWEENCAAIADRVAKKQEDPKAACGTNIWGRSVDEQTQGAWEVEGYKRAQSEWPWLGVMSIWYFREPDPHPEQPANWFAIVNPDFTPRPAYNALKAYSAALGPTPTRATAHKPLWDGLGFPFLYGVFGLFTLAAGTLGARSMGRWARVALNMPRGRYREGAREIARNGALVVGMALLVGLYYKTNSAPLMLLALAAWACLAFLKPSIGLAAVAFAIPFYWQPKVVGSQRFPVAETLLLLTFGAIIARHAVHRYLPSVAARLHMQEPPESGRPGPLAPGQPAPAYIPMRNGQGAARSLNGRVGRAVAYAGISSGYVPGMPGGGAAKTLAPPPEPTAAEENDLPGWPARPRPATLRYAVPTYERYVPPARLHGDVVPIMTMPLEDEKVGLLTGLKTLAEQVRRNPRLLLALARRNFLAWDREDAFAPPAVALLILGALSLLTLANPAYAPDSARAFRWEIVEPILFYFLLTEAIKGRRALLRVSDFFLAAAVAVSIFGLLQFVRGADLLTVEGVNRLKSVYPHPNNLALYLGRVTPFAVLMAAFLPWGWRKLLYALSTLPIAAALALTYSRAAWVAVVLAIGVAAFVGFRWRQGRAVARVSRRAWLVAGGVGLLLVVGGVAAYPHLPERIKTAGSGVLRIAIWKTAAHMLVDHPLLGIGPDQFLNQFQTRYQHYYVSYVPLEAQREPDTAHPHDLILDYWLSLGIMGLFVLLWLLWKYFREAINRVKLFAVEGNPVGKALALGLLASMIDFLVHGLVDNSYFLMDLALVFWLCCGMLKVTSDE